MMKEDGCRVLQKYRTEKFLLGMILNLCVALFAAFMPSFTQKMNASSWKLKHQSIHIRKGQKVSLVKKAVVSMNSIRFFSYE